MPRFANHGVDAQIQWPRKETVITFGRWEIIAFPPSKDHDASLHIDLNRARLAEVEAMSVLNQLLSIASWLDDTFAVLLDGWSGNPVPCRPSRTTRASPSSILDDWCNAWNPIEDARARRALAIYREALNMRHFHSLPYAVLGFYKILETTLGGREREAYLEQEIGRLLEGDGIDGHYLREIGFERRPSPRQLACFLWNEGRLAVAHASKEPTVDPDDVGQQRKMSVAAEILRAVTRHYIQAKLGVGTNRWDQGDRSY